MRVGDCVLFKGYRGNPAGYQPVLKAGDTCVIEKIDDDVGLTVRRIPTQIRETIREWVLIEEVLAICEPRQPADPRPDPARVFKMMAHERTKDFTDLRDRVAYMFVTGAHPTNLRAFFTGALNVLSTHSDASGRFGPHLVDCSAIYTLRLIHHPMVVEARRLVSEGWRLVVSLGPNERRPYGRLYFSREQHRLTLHAEGWTKPGWPQDWPKRPIRRTA